MKRTVLVATMMCIILALTGCGGGGGGGAPPAPPTFVTQIHSDPVFDGDIAQDPILGVFTVTQSNTQSVFAGINPSTGTESRGFLDFPLRDAGGVPSSAVIDSAILDIVIDSILPQPLIGTIPIRVDLVAFQPPTLVGTDFDRTILQPLATITIPPISQADVGRHVSVDVTPLMVEAQRLHLVNFQIRILEDLGVVTPGLIEINDTTGVNRGALAPILQVTYF